MEVENKLVKVAEFRAVPLSILCQNGKCQCKELEEGHVPGIFNKIGLVLTGLGALLLFGAFMVLFKIYEIPGLNAELFGILMIAGMISLVVGPILLFFKSFKIPWEKDYYDSLEVYSSPDRRKFLLRFLKGQGNEALDVPLVVGEKKEENILQKYLKRRRMRRLYRSLFFGIRKANFSPDLLPNHWRLIAKKCGDYYIVMLNSIENLFGKDPSECRVSPFSLKTLCLTKEDASRLIMEIRNLEKSMVFKVAGELKKMSW